MAREIFFVFHIENFGTRSEKGSPPLLYTIPKQVNSPPVISPGNSPPVISHGAFPGNFPPVISLRFMLRVVRVL